MTENQAKLQQSIKESDGWDSQVGWNIYNGVLTQVTIVVNASEIGDKTISSVEKVAKDAVAKIFKEPPRL